MGAVRTMKAPPIDVVYTWADSEDAQWRLKRDRYLREDGGELGVSSIGPHRWRNSDELRYSMRSVLAYAPFVRKIFIVTDSQRPGWLGDDPRVQVVDHREIFSDWSVLPTFSTRAIEANVHRIAVLAEHFLLMNDDFFFASPLSPEDFINADDGRLIYRVYPKLVFHEPLREAEDTWFSSVAAAFRALERRYPNRYRPYCRGSLRERRRTAREPCFAFNEVSHQVQIYRRSLCYETERRFQEEVQRTIEPRFRRHGSCNMHALRAYDAIVHGYASARPTSRRESLYLSSEASLRRWNRVRWRLLHAPRWLQPKFLCLNDCSPDPARGRIWGEFLGSLLDRLMPNEMLAEKRL